MKYSFKIIFLSLLLPMAFWAQNGKNASPIAYVEETVLLKALKGYEKNTRTIDSLKQGYEQEIASATKAVEKKIADLLVPYAVTNTETMESLKAKLKLADTDKLELYTKEKALLNKAKANYTLVLQTLYEQKIQPLLDKLNSTLATYAKAKGIKMIYTLEKMAPALAYIDPDLNITPEIIKLL